VLWSGHSITGGVAGPEILNLLEKRGLLPAAEGAKAQQLNQLTDLLLEATTPSAAGSIPGPAEPAVPNASPSPVRFSDASAPAQGTASGGERSAGLVQHVFVNGVSRFVSKWPGFPQVFSEPVPDGSEGSAAKVYLHTYVDETTGDGYQIDSFAMPGFRKFATELFAAAKEEVLKVEKNEWVKDTIQNDPERAEAICEAVYITKGSPSGPSSARRFSTTPTSTYWNTASMARRTKRSRNPARLSSRVFKPFRTKEIFRESLLDRVAFEVSMNGHWLYQVLERLMPGSDITLANPFSSPSRYDSPHPRFPRSRNLPHPDHGAWSFGQASVLRRIPRPSAQW